MSWLRVLSPERWAGKRRKQHRSTASSTHANGTQETELLLRKKH